MNEVYATFGEAYVQLLREVLYSPEYRNAPRGFASRERLGTTFRLTDPVQRHVALPARRANIVFQFAEVLWYLAGSRDLDPIAHYAPSLRRYSADGRTLAGTAYGPRLFAYGGARVDQWEQVKQTLASDPDTKRAVIQIFDPGELAAPTNPDVACTIAIQFLIRDGRLTAVTYMRANDAFRGIVSDVFSFTFLLELLAGELGLEVGDYIHSVGSFHVYETDLRRAEEVVAAGGVGAPAHDFPQMPAGDNWPHIRTVLDLEAGLRRDRLRLSRTDLVKLDLPDYWRQVVTLFEVYRALRYDRAVPWDKVRLLEPVYQRAVANRWPTRWGCRG